jgi:peptidoglycan/xylan/chitin deacetylase (PgdA/CDA1 family)
MTRRMGGGGPVHRVLAAPVYYGGIFGLLRWFRRRRLVVLTYHGVLQRTDGGFLHRNCVSVEEFDRHVEFLKRHYRLLTLDQALDGIAGRVPLPPYSALITFDDGFRNNAELAGPVLAAHGVPAAMFVTTGMLDHHGTLPWVEHLSAGILLTRATTLELEFEGRQHHYDLALPGERERASDELRRHLKNAPTAERERVMEQLEAQCPLQAGDLDPERFDFMSWEDARRLARQGVDIGSHTVRHLCLSTLDPEELRDEIGTSRRRIEEELGLPCLTISYPDGTPESFGLRDREALRAAGYRAAFSQIRGTNAVGDDMFALKRINVPGGTADLRALILTLAGLRRAAASARRPSHPLET